MNTPSAKMWVLVGEKFACVKINGRANFNSSIDFRTVLNELQVKGYNYFVLDLSECQLMDSTFLGVLAGFGLKMNPPQRASRGTIELLNPNARISELLENLGVIHLFTVRQGAESPACSGEAQPVEPAGATREDMSRACLEAHKTLMEISPGNVAKFKDLTQFLAEDLKKAKGAAAQA
jgi:anti-anti-sigma regulatory factor